MNLKTEFPQTTCLSCDVKIVQSNKSSVIERSIEFDERSFGNRTFDCVLLAKFYCEFDYVRLSSAIERLVFDWVLLPNCSIRYPGLSFSLVTTSWYLQLSFQFCRHTQRLYRS